MEKSLRKGPFIWLMIHLGSKLHLLDKNSVTLSHIAQRILDNPLPNDQTTSLLKPVIVISNLRHYMSQSRVKWCLDSKISRWNALHRDQTQIGSVAVRTHAMTFRQRFFSNFFLQPHRDHQICHGFLHKFILCEGGSAYVNDVYVQENNQRHLGKEFSFSPGFMKYFEIRRPNPVVHMPQILTDLNNLQPTLDIDEKLKDLHQLASRLNEVIVIKFAKINDQNHCHIEISFKRENTL